MTLTTDDDSENYHSLSLSLFNFTYFLPKHLVLFSYINLQSVLLFRVCAFLLGGQSESDMELWLPSV